MSRLRSSFFRTDLINELLSRLREFPTFVCERGSAGGAETATKQITLLDNPPILIELPLVSRVSKKPMLLSLFAYFQG